VLSVTDDLNLTLTSAYAGTTASGLRATSDPNLLAIENGAGSTKLTVSKTGSLSLNGLAFLTLPSATADALDIAVAGDSTYHFGIRGDGYIKWGAGTAGTDTYLYRAGVGSLKTDGLFTAAGGVVIGSGGAQISRFLSATTTWDPPSVATGAAITTTITVTNAALGDTAAASFSLALPDNVTIAASVSVANTVKVTIVNLSGGAVDLASGTLRADVWQH
jgi:hypothetical protein